MAKPKILSSTRDIEVSGTTALYPGDKVGMNIEKKVQQRKYEPATIGFWGETTIQRNETGEQALSRLEIFLESNAIRKLNQLK